MAVRREIHHRVGAHIGEHLVARGIDPFAEILERTGTLAQVDAPDVFAARAAGHVAGEVEPVTVGRHGRMAVARERVGRDLELHGRAPLGIAALRGVDFYARVRVGFATGAGEIHRRAVGRERYNPFLGFGVEFAFDRFGTFPFAAFVFRGHPYIALFHAVDFAALGAVDLLVGRGEIEAVERCVEIHRRVVRASRVEELGVFDDIAGRVGFVEAHAGADEAVRRRCVAGFHHQIVFVGFHGLGIFALGVEHLRQFEVCRRVGPLIAYRVLISRRGAGALAQQAVTFGHLVGHFAAQRTFLALGQLVIDFAVGLRCVVIFAALHLLVGDR